MPDMGQIILLRGTKGGRERRLPINSDEKREALDLARRVAITEAGHLGNPHRTLVQNLNRFYYVAGKYGITRSQLQVTAHGLRHEWANDAYLENTGRTIASAWRRLPRIAMLIGKPDSQSPKNLDTHAKTSRRVM